jgi:hypothetical protein
MSLRLARTFLLPSLVLAGAGCGADSSDPNDPGDAMAEDAGADGSTPPTRVVNTVQLGLGVDRVDLLLAIENSGRMAQEQAKLGALLPRLIGVLTSGNRAYPDAPGPGDEFTAVRSLHVGVVTSDLGRPPGVQSPVAGCAEDNGRASGGGGHLQIRGSIAAGDQRDDTQTGSPVVSAGVPACAPVSLAPPYVAFGNDAGGPTSYPTDPRASDFQNASNPLFQLACIATVGTGGCGVEQHLEGIWKSLAPSSRSDFYGPATAGLADTDNSGFARADSVLAVLHVATEDDCSVTPQGAFMFEQGDVQGYAPGVRCQMLKDQPQYAAALQPIERYAEGLIGLRAAFPERLVYAAIVGLPQGDSMPYADPDALLALPSMQAQLTPSDKTRILPVCGSDASGNGGVAFPGRRAVRLAKALKERSGDFLLRSVCDDDYGPAMDLLVEKIAVQLKGACLPRALRKDAASGRVGCDVVEVLAKTSSGADVGSCSGPGRSAAGTRQLSGALRTACKVEQLAVQGDAAPAGEGWYYDDFSEELRAIPGCAGQRVVFTKDADLQPGAEALLECE